MQIFSPLKNLFDLLGGAVIVAAIAINQPATTSAKTAQELSQNTYPVMSTIITGTAKTEAVELVNIQKYEEEDGKTVPPNLSKF